MSPIPSLREESREAGWLPGEETPGICGMSALKRSAGGLEDITGYVLSLYWKPRRYSKRKESRMPIPTGPALRHPARYRLVTSLGCPADGWLPFRDWRPVDLENSREMSTRTAGHLGLPGFERLPAGREPAFGSVERISPRARTLSAGTGFTKKACWCGDRVLRRHPLSAWFAWLVRLATKLPRLYNSSFSQAISAAFTARESCRSELPFMNAPWRCAKA